MMTVVYSKPLKRRYLASRCSSAYALYLFITACCIVSAFFIAYSASGPDFWSKYGFYPEQPKVQYQYKAILILEGIDGANARQISFSSMSSVNVLFGNTLRAAVLRTSEIDDNGDSVPDRLELNAIMPIRSGETVNSVKLLLFYDVKLWKHARLKMDAMSYLSHSSPLNGGALFIDGDLEWNQRTPLPVRGGTSEPYANEPLLDPASLLPWRLSGSGGARHIGISSLISRYRSRNFTMDLNSRYVDWQQPTDEGDTARSFNLSLIVRYPHQTIMYSPAISEVLLDAWIRYLAVMVIVVYLLDLFCAYMYHNQLVETHVQDSYMSTSHSKVE